MAKENPLQGGREECPKHSQTSRVSLCLLRASMPCHCRQRGLWQKFKQLLGSRYLCDLCFLWPSWILCKFLQPNYYEIYKKMHCLKSLNVIKPGLILIIPRNISYHTNQSLFAFFFLSRLFFQEKVVWVWESELKENLAMLKELERR